MPRKTRGRAVRRQAPPHRRSHTPTVGKVRGDRTGTCPRPEMPMPAGERPVHTIQVPESLL
ncbi:hypothetical protein [Streptomyces xanthii]|uniref:Uncharacterized protein n=1 Tax=Streptomyces xanthii TaxID=2768069 RepID=A0A7H1B0N3_9ACTN|nr:hypothetical protein [Streptomyces xanthii]QNS02288.1 hypothetical protein IAG42_00805 [Streptomyces xanthii]